MPVDIRSAVYSGISQQFPAIYREDGDFLVSFIETYYKYFDETYDRDIPKLRDIDTTLTKFLLYYKKKYLADLPIDTNLDTRFIIKHIQDMYSRKGTQESLELLFRMFFDEDIEVFYPSTAVLRPSDSIWGGDSYLEMKPVFKVDGYPVLKGQRIKGDVSHATAFVDEVIFVNFSGALIPLVYLSSLSGTFTSDDGIQVLSTNDAGEEVVTNVGRLIHGSIDLVTVDTVEDRLPDQSIGDNVKFISSKGGLEAEGRVLDVSDTPTGSIEFSIVDGGFGYLDPESTTLTVKNEIGISNQVMVLSGTTKLDIERGDIIIASGAKLNYDGSDTGTQYSITGSAKVIQYNHPLLFLYSDTVDTVKDYLNRVATPTAGPDAGTTTNVYLQTMKNVALIPHFEDQVVPGAFLPPRYLPEEYTKEYRALSLPNQTFFESSPANQIDLDNLGVLYPGDDDGYGYTQVNLNGNLNGLGVKSRQAVQEYINVLNITNNFPTISPVYGRDSDYYDQIIAAGNPVYTGLYTQWIVLIESLLLGLSKVGIFPQMTIAEAKPAIPTESTFLEDGEDYMVWDNGSSSMSTSAVWSNITGGATQTLVEGDIITIDYSAHQMGSDQGYLVQDTFTDFVRFIPRAGRTDEELQAIHLNRLRININSPHDELGYTVGRVADYTGVRIDYPNINSPQFSLKRYRGDLAQYDPTVTDVTKVVTDFGYQSFGVANRSANFEIGALTNVETVSIIPDQIVDFGSTKLNIPAGEPGGSDSGDGIEFDDYGMSGPGAENFGTRIADAFSPITLKIGTISQLKVLDTGIDYQNDVAISIDHLPIKKFNKKDYILNFDTVNFNISDGDIITQDIKIPDLQINQSGNFIHQPFNGGDILLVRLGSVTTGVGYENSSTTFEFTTGDTKDYQVKAKFLKREGNDFYFKPLSFYGFEGNISVFRMKGNQEYKIISIGNIPLSDWTAIGASDNPQVGEIFVSKSDEIIDATITAGYKGIVAVPVLIGSIKKTLTSITQDPDSAPMGANAEIIGPAFYQTGQVSKIGVTKTGYRYSDREKVDVVNNEPNSSDYNKVIAKAELRTLGQGKTEGKWSSKTSFLSESSKNLHDNDYYQEYSYEISSIISPERYEPLIKETVGVAGTKLFSKPLVNSVNPLDSNLNLEISSFNIQGTQLASIKQIPVTAIEQGRKYLITDKGNTAFSQWNGLGATIDESDIIVGGINLERNQPYRVVDMGDAHWENVQYLDEFTRNQWFVFWTGFDRTALFSFVDITDENGDSSSIRMLEVLRMVMGTQEMEPELQEQLLAFSNYLVSTVGYRAMYSDATDDYEAPSIVNSVQFVKLTVNEGQEFTALRDGSSQDGTAKVSYSDSIFVTPYYKNDLSERADHTWGSFTPPQTYLNGSNPIQLLHNELLDDPDDQAGITNYTHDNARTIRYSDMETGSGIAPKFWRIKSFPITGNDSTDGHNEYMSAPNSLPDKHIKSWNPEDMSAESNLQKDYLQGLWQTYFRTGLEAVTGGAKEIGTRDDPTTYPNIETTLLQSYGTGFGVVESDDVGVPLVYYPNTITSSTGWSISRLELVDVTDNTIIFEPDTMVGEDGYTITLSNHGMTNDTLLEYRKHTSTGSSGNLDEEYVVSEFVPGSGTYVYSERDIQPHYYYAVNVTENTFQLSKTPMLLDKYPNDVLHDPIDLSTMTDSASGNHLLTKVTGIFADDSILIGIQEQ